MSICIAAFLLGFGQAPLLSPASTSDRGSVDSRKAQWGFLPPRPNIAEVVVVELVAGRVSLLAKADDFSVRGGKKSPPSPNGPTDFSRTGRKKKKGKMGTQIDTQERA